MTHKLQTTLSSKMVMTFLVILSLTAITLSSCTKKSDSNDGAKFVGTWNGTGNCGSGSSAGSLVISAGSNGTTVTTPGNVGSGTCYKAVSYTMTASGNTLTIPTQNFTDLCGNTYTISGSGALSGTTITLTFSTSGAATGTCVFTGTK